MQKQGLTYQAVRSPVPADNKVPHGEAAAYTSHLKFPSVSDKAHREDQTAGNVRRPSDSDRETDGYN